MWPTRPYRCAGQLQPSWVTSSPSPASSLFAQSSSGLAEPYLRLRPAPSRSAARRTTGYPLGQHDKMTY